MGRLIAGTLVVPSFLIGCGIVSEPAGTNGYDAQQKSLQESLRGLTASEFAPLQRMIGRFAHRIKIPQNLIEDFAQDVWVSVARQLARDPEYQAHNLETWLHTVVRRRGIEWLRREHGKPLTVRTDLVGTPLEPCSDNDDPAKELDLLWHKEVLLEVWIELRKRVGDRNYDIFIKTWKHDCSTVSVAEDLGMTPDQVRHKKARLLKTFRRLLAKRLLM